MAEREGHTPPEGHASPPRAISAVEANEHEGSSSPTGGQTQPPLTRTESEVSQQAARTNSTADDLWVRVAERQNEIADRLVGLQEGNSQLFKELKTDSKRQFWLGLAGVAGAVTLAIIAFFALLDQKTASTEQTRRLSSLSTDLEVALKELDGLSTDIADVAASGRRFVRQDAIAKDVPPTVASISDNCGSVDLAKATINLTNPRECDYISVSFQNRGITAARVRPVLRIGGIYNIECAPIETPQRVAPQREVTFLFYIGACLAPSYTSLHSEPAPATLEVAYEKT